MVHIGIATVSFQTLPVMEALAVCAAAGAAGVEVWGRDHLPEASSPAEVARVRASAASLGLAVPAYGSYARAGADDWGADRFACTLAVAEDLGATTVRVWAGARGSTEATPEEWAAVTDTLRRWGDLAAAQGIVLVVERHCGTLTDDGDTARRLIDRVAHPAVWLNYQVPYPAPVDSYADLEADLRLHLPVSRHIHVQNYRPDDLQRAPIAEGVVDYAAWRPLLAAAAFDGWAMLEFLPVVEGVAPAEVAAQQVAALRACWGDA